MIRGIIIIVYLVLYLILTIPVLGIEWIIGKFNKNLEDRQCLWLVQQTFANMVRIAGAKVTVIGEENVPDEPVLYICNHRSYFDILLTYPRVPRPTGYVSKIEMDRIPLLRTWMRRLYCLFLDRDDMRQGMKTILKAIDYVKQGISICIFPEGTRNPGEETSLLPFHAGSFRIAEKSGCPIIPVSINNSASMFENHFPFVRKAHVIIEYGKPIYPDELSKEEKKHLSDHCRDIMSETLKRNQKLV